MTGVAGCLGCDECEWYEEVYSEFDVKDICPQCGDITWKHIYEVDYEM